MSTSAWTPVDESAWKPVEEAKASQAKPTWASHLSLTGSGEESFSPLGTLREFARQGIDVLQGAAHGAMSTATGIAKVGEALTGQTALRKVLHTPDPLAAAAKMTPDVPESIAGKIGEVGEHAAEFFGGGEVASAASAGMKLLPRVLAQAAAGGGVAAAQSGADPTATATGTIMGGIGSLVGEALNPLMASVGRKIQATTIRPRLTDMKNGFSWDAVDKLDLSGNLEQSLNQVQHHLADLRAQRNALIAPGTANVDLDSALNAAEHEINQDVAALKFAGQGAKIKGAFNALREDIENSVGTGPVDIRLAENAKEHLGTLGAWAYGRPDADSQITEQVANKLYPHIRSAIENAIGPLGAQVKDLNGQMSELIPVKNAMLARLPVEERNRMFSLQDLAMLTPAIVTGDLRLLGLEALSRGQKSLRLGNWLQRAAHAPSSGAGPFVKAGAQEALQPSEVPAMPVQPIAPEQPINVGSTVGLTR